MLSVTNKRGARVLSALGLHALCILFVLLCVLQPRFTVQAVDDLTKKGSPSAGTVLISTLKDVLLVFKGLLKSLFFVLVEFVWPLLEILLSVVPGVAPIISTLRFCWKLTWWYINILRGALPIDSLYAFAKARTQKLIAGTNDNKDKRSSSTPLTETAESGQIQKRTETFSAIKDIERVSTRVMHGFSVLMLVYALLFAALEHHPKTTAMLDGLSASIKVSYTVSSPWHFARFMLLPFLAVLALVALIVEPIYVLLTLVLPPPVEPVAARPTAPNGRNANRPPTYGSPPTPAQVPAPTPTLRQNPFSLLAWALFPWEMLSFDVYAWQHYPGYRALRMAYYVVPKVVLMLVLLDRFVLVMLWKGLTMGFENVLAVFEAAQNMFQFFMNQPPPAPR